MGKTAVVFGAGGGIGSAVVRELIGRGFGVHLVGRSEGPLRALAEALDASAVLSVTTADVRDAATLAGVAAAIGGPLDALVYAVGTINLRSLARLTEAEFVEDFRVNALGAALAVQSLLPALKRSAGAAVVFFSSIAASQGFAMHASVAMAKGAIEGLTVALAAELAPKIRVNAVAPSLTRTPLAGALVANEQMAAAIADAHPIPRLGDPADSARVAAFLADGESSWITGQVLHVDGGRSTVRTKG